MPFGLFNALNNLKLIAMNDKVPDFSVVKLRIAGTRNVLPVHDLEIMGLNLIRVELGVSSTFVKVIFQSKINIIKNGVK